MKIWINLTVAGSCRHRGSAGGNQAPGDCASGATTPLCQYDRTEELMTRLDPAARQLMADINRSRIIGSHVFKLDKRGVLELPGIASIPLAGLTAEEVAIRLESEPLLAPLKITVTISAVDAGRHGRAGAVWLFAVRRGFDRSRPNCQCVTQSQHIRCTVAVVHACAA